MIGPKVSESPCARHRHVVLDRAPAEHGAPDPVDPGRLRDAGASGYVIGMIRRVVAGCVLAVLLSACAARPTPYQPRDGAFGYAQTQLDGRTWRVEFAGNTDTPRETVENYLLYRAAEVMLFGGHDRFIILEKEVERTRDYRHAGPYPYRAGWGFGAPHRARHRHRGRYRGYGAPHTFVLDSYKAIATIRTYNGGPPAAGLQVYGAREVIAQLGQSVILRP